MQLPTALSLAAVLSLQISSVLAIPIAEPVQPEGGLEKRAGTGTPSDPFILNIDCSGVTEVCEAQCVAILCFSAPQVMQYGGAGSSTAQRKASGAGSSPFKASGGSPTTTGGTVEMPPSHPTWTSPEDTTNACAVEGGIGTLIAPVDATHNSLEGSQVSGQLKTNKVAKNQYFKKKYSNTGPYCTALMQGSPASATCSGTKSADDPIKFLYRRTTEKSGNSFLWQQMVYDQKMTWSKTF